jgi:YVTN family beta-propeller protein
MDLSTGRSVSRVRLDFRPKFAVFLEEQNLLAVSLSLSQKVVLLDPLSLAVVGTIPTGGEPQGLLVSNNHLYIAEGGDNTVSIVDLARRGALDRLTVGFGPRRLLEVDNRIYVTNYEDGSLSVLVPGQLGVIQEIRGLGQPLEMALDQFYRRLYVADEKAAALAVIDVNANHLLGFISLGAKPVGLGVIQ